MTKIYSSIYCRKTDENNLFVELDNNKQVEHRVKRGTYKVRNEIETKRNETKRNEINENETKRNETKSTKTKRNETKSTK